MIDDYLGELLERLQLPARRRRRILAEVEDHLACAAADLHAEGLDAEQAERAAIERFGPAHELAQTFLEHEAARRGMRAAQRGAFVVVGCAAAGLLDAMLRALAGGHTWSADGWTALGVLLAGAAVTGATVARAREQARRVPPSESADEPRDIVETLGRYVPWVRRHPWRFAATIAIGAGLALAAAHSLSEGGFSLHHLDRQLQAAGLLVSVEALAALLGFAVLGRYLGLRSDTGAAAAEP